MKKILALIIVALVVPSIALAAKPNPPGQSQATHGNPQSNNHSKAPKVLYVLKGVITEVNITNASTPVNAGSLSTSPAGPSQTSVAFNSYACDNGTVTITVNRVNHKRVFKALTDNNDPLTLTLCLNAKTKLIVKSSGNVDLANATGDTTYNNDGIVKVRFAKKFDPTNTDQLTMFLSTAAKQVIVKKALPTS